MERRHFLVSAAALGCVAISRVPAARAQAPPLVYADMHSHIGLLGGPANIRDVMTANGIRRGLRTEDVRTVLGGNYLRALRDAPAP